MALPTSSWADAVTFRGMLNAKAVTATVDVSNRDGVPYVSLQRVAEQLGAGFSVNDGRIQVDLGGNTAWLKYGDTEAYGSVNRTRLLYPLVRNGDDTLISEADVVPLFSTCFKVVLARKDHAAAESKTNPEDPFAPNVMEPVNISKPAANTESAPAPAPVTDTGITPPTQPAPDAGTSPNAQPAPEAGTSPTAQPAPEAGAPPSESTESTPNPAASPAPLSATGADLTAPTGAAPIERIVIDPGHGGSEIGAVGQGGLQEKTLTLAVAQKLKGDLEKALSAKVILTRSDDRELSLAQRSNIGVRVNPELFVSLHAGASRSTTAVGFELFCPPAVVRGMGKVPGGSDDKALAAQIEKSMEADTQATSRGIRTAPIRVLREQQQLALLIELGCITNPTEEALLASPDYQAKLAQGISDGIVAYLHGAQGAEQ